MKRRDLLIAKLKAKQKVREALIAHKTRFAPPPPQQEMMNNASNPQQTQTPPAADQPTGYGSDNGLGGQP
jgi:hypothetical protein